MYQARLLDGLHSRADQGSASLYCTVYIYVLQYKTLHIQQYKIYINYYEGFSFQIKLVSFPLEVYASFIRNV